MLLDSAYKQDTAAALIAKFTNIGFRSTVVTEIFCHHENMAFAQIPNIFGIFQIRRVLNIIYLDI